MSSGVSDRASERVNGGVNGPVLYASISYSLNPLCIFPMWLFRCAELNQSNHDCALAIWVSQKQTSIIFWFRLWILYDLKKRVGIVDSWEIKVLVGIHPSYEPHGEAYRSSSRPRDPRWKLGPVSDDGRPHEKANEIRWQRHNSRWQEAGTQQIHAWASLWTDESYSSAARSQRHKVIAKSIES